MKEKVIFYMSTTMSHIIFAILSESTYVMLFAIAYAAYYCCFPFSASSWINICYTMVTFVILTLFVLYSIISFHCQLLPGIFGPFPGISDHIWYKMCNRFEATLSHFSSSLFCPFHFLAISGSFPSISGMRSIVRNSF